VPFDDSAEALGGAPPEHVAAVVSANANDQAEQLSHHGTKAVVGLAIAGPAFANSFGRFAFGVFLPALIGPLLSDSKILAGWAAATGALGYTVGSFVLTRHAGDQTLLRTRMAIGLGGSGLAALLGATATSTTQLFVALFIFGVASAPVWITASVLASRAFAARNRATALSVAMIGAGLGTALVPIIYSGFHAVNARDGWRYTWLLTAAVCVTLSALARITLKPIRAVPRSRDERNRVIALPLAIRACYVCYGAAFSLMLTYFVIAIDHEAHFSSLHVQTDQALVGVFLVAGVFVARIADRVFVALGTRHGRLVPLMVTGVVYGATGPLALIGREPFFAFAAVCFGLGAAGNTVLIAAVVRDTVGYHDFARSMAVMTVIYAVTQVFAPFIGAYLGAASSYRAALLGVGAAGLGATITAALLYRPPRAVAAVAD
jgi:MFS family permease